MDPKKQNADVPAQEENDDLGMASFVVHATSDEDKPVSQADGDDGADDNEGDEGGHQLGTDDGEDDEGGDDDHQSSVDDGEDDEPDDKEYSARVQKRIAKLTQARRAAEREAAELKARVERLERGLLAQKEPDSGNPKPTESVQKDDDAPDPKKYTYGEVDPKYIADLARYNAEQVIRERDERQAQEAAQRAAEAKQAEDRARAQEFLRKGAEKHKDFIAKVTDDSVPFTDVIGEMLFESDAGPEIAYYLANNPTVALEVAQKSPVEQARWFGRIEAKFTGAASPVNESVKKPTKAPMPVNVARGAGGKFAPSPDTSDFTKFEELAKSKGLM